MEEEGQVLHQIAKGISKRIVGGLLDLLLHVEEMEAASLVRLVGGAREVSRVEGAW